MHLLLRLFLRVDEDCTFSIWQNETICLHNKHNVSFIDISTYFTLITLHSYTDYDDSNKTFAGLVIVRQQNSGFVIYTIIISYGYTQRGKGPAVALYVK